MSIIPLAAAYLVFTEGDASGWDRVFREQHQ